MSLPVWIGPASAPELEQAVTAAGAVVVEKPLDAEVFVWFGEGPARFPELVHPGVRWVQFQNAGIEPWVDAGVMTPDRLFTSAAGSYAPVVAEHTLALLLAAAKNLPTLARARRWTTTSPGTLRGSRIGIVGCGGIGRELIRLLAPLGVEVLAVTRSGKPVPGAASTTTPDGLDEVLSAADHVVLAAPATAETAALIGAPELARMRPTAWLVNIARGALVDTDALVTALRQGTIAGAALDVTDPEPLPEGHPLWDEPRALITPHSANSPRFLVPALAGRVEENVRRFLRGEELVGTVDLERGY